MNETILLIIIVQKGERMIRNVIFLFLVAIDACPNYQGGILLFT